MQYLSTRNEASNMKRYNKVLRYFFIWKCIYVVCESKLQPISQNTFHGDESLTKCIIAALKPYVLSKFDKITYGMPNINNFFKHSNLEDLEGILLPTIANSLKKDMIIKTTYPPIPNFGLRSKTIIIHFTDLEDLQNQINGMKFSKLLQTSAKFLVFSAVYFENHCCEQISRYLWSENIYNFVVIFPKGKITRIFQLVTWNPYEQNNCGQHFEKNSYSFSECSFGLFQKHVDWFGEKIPKKFEKCVIKVHYLNRPPYVITSQKEYLSEINQQKGLEIQLISTIAESLNFNLVYPKLENNAIGGIRGNKTFIGVFKEFKTKAVDIAIGGYVKTPNLVALLDSSRSYIQDSLVWCVPHVLIITNSETEFSVIMAYTFAIVFIFKGMVSFLIAYLSRRLKNELEYYNTFGNTYLDMFTIFINCPIPRNPKTRQIRVFFGLYMIFGFIFGIAYKSSFMSHLTNPIFIEKYASLKDIYDYKLQTYFATGFRFFFSNIEEINGIPTTIIRKNWITCTNINECLKYVALNRNSSVCLSRTFVDYYSNTEVENSIFCLSNVQINYNVNIVMRKGFPLHRPIDNVISKLVSGGIIEKWNYDLYPKKIKTTRQGSKTVTLSAMQQVFVMHLLLLTLCIITFILEHVVYKCKYKN